MILKFDRFSRSFAAPAFPLWLGMIFASQAGACCRSPGRSVNCAAAEKARARISNVTISPAMPDAAKIMATIMN
jgi:hypothetical protein